MLKKRRMTPFPYFPGMKTLIYEYLPPGDHARAARTCQEWHAESGLVNSAYLHTSCGALVRRHLGWGEASVTGMCPFGSKRVSVRVSSARELEQIAVNLPQSLVSLEITGPIDADALATVRVMCPGITKLRLDLVPDPAPGGTPLSDRTIDVSAIVSTASRLAHLVDLEVSHVSGQVRLVDPASALMGLPVRLTRLVLGNLCAGGYLRWPSELLDPVDINAILARLQDLRELVIERNESDRIRSQFQPSLDVQNLSTTIQRITLMNCGERGWHQRRRELVELEYIRTNSIVFRHARLNGTSFAPRA